MPSLLVEGVFVQVIQTAVALMVRSMVLSAQSAGQQRLLWLQQSAAVGGEVGEVARLRDENRQLKWENRLLKARDADAPCRKRYSPLQRLQILWHMELCSPIILSGRSWGISFPREQMVSCRS